MAKNEVELSQPLTDVVAEQPVNTEPIHTSTAEIHDGVGALMLTFGALAFAILVKYRDIAKGPRDRV